MSNGCTCDNIQYTKMFAVEQSKKYRIKEVQRKVKRKG